MVLAPGYPHPIMNHIKHMSGRVRWVACSGMILFTQIAAATAAVLPPGGTPPQPASNKGAPAAWVGMLLMVVLVGIVLAISLMPSRRSHQD
ncbi:MAG: hypothetical protein CMJ24_11910 [Phycisphaerae bacterium]|nr:hypothetical protein [Phycisphaerae bacterium]